MCRIPDLSSQISSARAFYVNYTAPTAREAQQICNQLTAMLFEEDLVSRQRFIMEQRAAKVETDAGG
jgi:hypothetical protein